MSEIRVYLTRSAYANFPGFSFPSLLIRMLFSSLVQIVARCQRQGNYHQFKASQRYISRSHLKKNFSCFPFGSGKIPFTLKFPLQTPSLAFMKEAEGQNYITVAVSLDIFNSKTPKQHAIGHLVLNSFIPCICKIFQ